MISHVMHKVKKTHSEHASKRKFDFHEIRPNLFLGRQMRDLADLKVLEAKGVLVMIAGDCYVSEACV